MDCGSLRKICRVPAVFLALIVCWNTASAQDVLGLFMSGNDRTKSMGGNPFASLEQEDFPSSANAVPIRRNVNFDLRYDNIYHEVHPDGVETLLQSSTRQISVSLPFSEAASSPKLKLNVISFGSIAIADQSPSERGNYQSEHKAVTLGYETPLGPSMRVGIGIGQSYGNPQSFTNYESNFSFMLPEGMSINGRIGNWEQSQVLQLQISGTDGILPLDYTKRGVHFSVSIPLGNVKLVGSEYSDYIYPATNISRLFATRFAPNGTDNGYQLQCMVSDGKKLKTLLSAREETVNGNGVFYSNDQKYGSLSGFAFKILALQSAVQYSLLSGGIVESDIKWQFVSGNLFGYAESWPFTSIFDSPIPLRENVSASGRMDILQLHVGGKVPVSEQFEFGLGVNLLRIRPNVELDSWESKYLVFGVRGYKVRTLALRLIDAAILSTGFRLQLQPFVIDYSITQFVPINIEKSGSSGGGSALSSSSGTVRASGGQFHRLSVEYEF
jgi:hypothetical protein